MSVGVGRTSSTGMVCLAVEISSCCADDELRAVKSVIK